jgi:hypothetical protein
MEGVVLCHGRSPGSAHSLFHEQARKRLDPHLKRRFGVGAIYGLKIQQNGI